MAGGRSHTPHPTPLNPPLVISYKNLQISLAYFSHLHHKFCYLLLKDRVKKGGPEGGEGRTQCSPLLNTHLTALHLFRDMIIIGKESTIAFSAIDKLDALFQNLEKAERRSDSTLVGLLSENQAKSNGL